MKKNVNVTYNSEELIKSEEQCFLIQKKVHMKFCQIFQLYHQIFLQTRFAGLRRNLDSALTLFLSIAQTPTLSFSLVISAIQVVKYGK